jgi:hypothetical protein
MLKTTAYILIFVIFGLTSCQLNQNTSSTQNDDSKASTSSKTTKELDGFWILTDYLDSIVKDKAIAKHSQYPISGEMMSFRIQNDSLFSKGIIFRGFKTKIILENDTIKQIRYPYTFYYNSQSDQIEATPLNLEKRSYFRRTDKEKYTYRRVNEKRLIYILQMRSIEGFHQLFIDSLIAGEYRSIENGKKLTLTNKYSMNGFKKYNKFEIHDYLEVRELDEFEINPFNSYDAIAFREHRGNYSEKDIPKWMKIEVFNWKFTGDTLTLTEMKDTSRSNTGYSDFSLGSNKFVFIRTK